MSRLRAAVPVLTLAAAVALSGPVLGRVYADGLLAVLVAGAAAGSVGVSAAARRLPSWAAAPLSAVLLGGYAVLALAVAARHVGTADPLPGVVADALVNGIPRLLTAMIPVTPAPDTVAAPVVAAWLAGLAGAEVVLRGRRVLLGHAPAVALFAAALYVVGPNAGAAVGAAGVLGGLVLLALVAAPDRPGPGRAAPGRAAPGRAAPGRAAAGGGPGGDGLAVLRRRAVAAGALSLALVTALAAAVGPWVAGRVRAEPVDPRRYVQPPRVDSLDSSPLNRISGWALAPRQRLLQVGPSGGDGRVRLRLAVLPDYDGVTWRVGATYRNAGRVLPAEPAPADADVQRVRQRVTVDGLTGRLLPAVPTPARVDGARVAYDAQTGTLMRPEGLAPGLAYTVESRRAVVDPTLLPAADAPAGPAVARYLAVGPGVPPSVQRLADELADGNGGAYDRAAAIEQFLAEHYRVRPDAPSGHAYPNLGFFLFGRRDQGGQAGTSEQFAASFAVLARLTGLPSRVVVGFQAPAAGGPVTGADALAWPEVLFDGLGWVAFDPMPHGDTPPRPVEQDFRPKPTTPPPSVSEPPPPSDAVAPPAAAAVAAPRPGGPPVLLLAAGAGGGALPLLAAAVAVTLLVRRRALTRRRLGGPPAARVTGAWREFTDALRLAGRPLPAHLDATGAGGFAARAGAPVRPAVPPAPPPADREPPLPPVDALVAAVNAAAFAPGGADAEQARRAGEQAVGYARALRARRSRWRRWCWDLHPGPLRWHRR